MLANSNVSDLSGAIETILDARIEARKAAAAAAAADSDISHAESLRDLLQVCQKIKEAQAALGRTDITLPKYCQL